MLYVGIDVGTTGTKSMVFNENGKVLGQGYYEYELSTPESGYIEQDANEWWNGIVTTVKKATENVDKKQIRGIGISTQGSTLAPTDSKCNTLCPAITWMDRRATEEVDTIDQKLGKDAVYKIAGWRAGTGSDVAKILWIKNNKPELFAKTDYFLSTLEFVNYKLCGKYITDPTNSAIRAIYDIKKNDYSNEIIEAIGTDIKHLPEVIPTGALVGNLTSEAAELLDLSTDISVYNGAHDQYCCAIGSGSTKPGDAMLATGTTWIVLNVTDKLVFCDSYIAPGIHPVKDCYGAMASLVSAGSALKWLKNVIGEDYKDIDNVAKDRIQNAKDLFFYPYICGVGIPHGPKGSHANGNIIGIDVHHDKFDLALALMEGVAFEAKIVLNEYKKQGMEIKKFMMTGGAAKSELWSQLVGYITGCEIYRPSVADTACVGAAMLAAVGSGDFEDYGKAAAQMIDSKPLILDNPELFDFYKEKSKRYEDRLPEIHKYQL